MTVVSDFSDKFMFRRRGELGSIAWSRYHQQMRLDPCVYCGGDGGELDHIFPRSEPSRGLTSELRDNCAGICRPCNQSKRRERPLHHLLLRAIRRELAPLLEEYENAGGYSHRKFIVR